MIRMSKKIKVILASLLIVCSVLVINSIISNNVVTTKGASIDEKEVIKVATKLHQYLKERLIKENIGIILYPPVSAPVDKIKNKYRWRIIIKCKLDDNIICLVNDMLNEYNKMKVNDTRVIVDVNPNDMAH